MGCTLVGGVNVSFFPTAGIGGFVAFDLLPLSIATIELFLSESMKTQAIKVAIKPTRKITAIKFVESLFRRFPDFGFVPNISVGAMESKKGASAIPVDGLSSTLTEGSFSTLADEGMV